MFFKTNFFYNIFFPIIFVFFNITLCNFQIIDLLFKINCNDNFFNMYSFFWVNFWYLFAFFFVILFFLSFIYFKNLIIFSIFLYFYFLEINNFFLSNFTYLFLNSNLNNFNQFLFNNINKYHPFIFYLSVIYCFFILFLFLSFFEKNLQYFNLENQIKNINLLKKKIFIINSVALFLGSWWAAQEGSWGGWWNWDASETLGLLIMLLSLYFIHSKSIFSNTVTNIYIYLLIFFSTLLSYYFIQLNFDLVSHNFGIKFFYFFNNNLFLLECLYLTLFMLILIKNHSFKFILFYCFIEKFQKNYIWNIYKYILLTIFFIIFLKMMLLSFNFLFNYFLWNFLFINSLNYEFTLINFSIIFIFLLIFTLNKINLNSLLISLLFTNFFFIIPSILLNTINFFSLLHFFINNFFLITFFSSYIDLLFNELNQSFYYLIFDFNNYLFGTNYTLDSFFFEKHLHYLTNGSWFFSWSLNNIINLFNNNNFYHYYDNLSFFNFMNINLNNTFYLLYFENFFNNNLMFISSFIFLSFSFFINKNSLYKF